MWIWLRGAVVVSEETLLVPLAASALGSAVASDIEMSGEDEGEK